MIGASLRPFGSAACAECVAINRLFNRDPRGTRCGHCGSALFTGQPVALSEASFERHRGVTTGLIVAFLSPRDAASRDMVPVITEATAQLEPTFRVGYIDTDEQEGLAMRLRFFDYPALAVFRQGEEVSRHQGAMDLPELLMWARKHK